MKRLLIPIALFLLSAATARAATTVDVQIGPTGFNPSTVNISAGDSVRWTNMDTSARNISSDPHPIHDAYPPLNIGTIGSGLSVTLTFGTAGTYGYHDHNLPSQTGTIVVQSVAQSTGGGSSVKPASAVLISPDGGQVYAAGARVDVFWQADGTGLTGIRLSLSLDGGTTYSIIADNQFHDGAYVWTVPNSPSTTARIKVDALGQGGSVLASDASGGDFMITGSASSASTPSSSTTTSPTTTAPSSTTASGQPSQTAPTTETTTQPSSAPSADTTVTGTFTASGASSANPDVDTDKGLEAPAEQATTPLCAAGSLIKGSTPHVYYCGKNVKRYHFPTEGVFFTWYKDFKSVKIVTDAVIAQIPLGGVVTHRPGVRLIKIQTDPKVYAVARGGTLRWLKDESVAVALYGSRWNRNIDVVPDSLFTQYRIGEPIAAP
jgi:plastocyanin